MTRSAPHSALPLHRRVDQVLEIIARSPGRFARFSTIRAAFLEHEQIGDDTIKMWCRSTLAHGYAQIKGGTKDDPIYRLTDLGAPRLPTELQERLKANPGSMSEQVARVLAQRNRVSLADAFEAGLKARAQAAAMFPAPTGPSMMAQAARKPKRPSRAQAERDNTGHPFCTALPTAADALRTAQIRGANSWVS